MFTFNKYIAVKDFGNIAYGFHIINNASTYKCIQIKSQVKILDKEIRSHLNLSRTKKR